MDADRGAGAWAASTYSNTNNRPSGRLMTLAGRVLPGIAAVQAQVAPYAEAWRTANAAALAAEGPLWVTLGDSMSQGIGASSWRAGWIGQAAARVDRDGDPFRIVNLSISGARVRDVLDRELPALQSLGVAPDLVTVLVGANDLGRRANRAALPDAFAELLERLPHGSVVATMPQPVRTARTVNALIARAAAERGIVPAEAAMAPGGWRGGLAADHWHPNDRGYAMIADTFVPAINRAFGQG